MQIYQFPELSETRVSATRHPIIDRDANIVAYALDNEKRSQNFGAAELDPRETWRDLSKIALHFGWLRFFDGKPAFIPCDIHLLERKLYNALPAEHCILLVDCHPRTINRMAPAIAAARRRGHRFTWDNVTGPWDDRLALAKPGDFVRINLRHTRLEDASLVIEHATHKGWKPILNQSTHAAELYYFFTKGAAAAQAYAIQPPETLTRLQLPSAPRSFLLALRALLVTRRSASECAQLVEHCPELLLHLLMLTDVAWHEGMRYPKTTIELLAGLQREALIAWLDIVAERANIEDCTAEAPRAASFVRAGLLARDQAEMAASSGPEFMLRIVAEILTTYPDLLRGRLQPVHLGEALRAEQTAADGCRQRMLCSALAAVRADALAAAKSRRLTTPPTAISAYRQEASKLSLQASSTVIHLKA